MKPKNTRSGISLMEMLIALALLSLIAAGLASSLGLGVRLFDRSEQVSDNSQALSARIRLRDLVATAQPANLITGYPVRFEGDAREVSFVTIAIPSGFAQAAALRVTISNERDLLSLNIEEILDRGEVRASHHYMLAEDVREVLFEYFDSSAGWQSEWRDETRIPQLLRITADAGSEPEWPEFTVALLLSE